MSMRMSGDVAAIRGVAAVFAALLGAGAALGGLVGASGQLRTGVVAVGVVCLAAALIFSIVALRARRSEAEPARGERRPVGGFLGAPARRTSRFVARREFEWLVAAVVGADGRPVAVVGMGGVGKTVLAAAAVRERAVRGRFRDGVAWLAVAPGADVLALQSELARRLGGGARVFGDADEGRGVLAGLLRGRRVLVVLDNVCERAVLDAVPPGCQLLFTSRAVGLAHDVAAGPVEVGELELEQAFALLAKWTGRERGELERSAGRRDLSALGPACAGGRRWPAR